jgi:hypothetical protein
VALSRASKQLLPNRQRTRLVRKTHHAGRHARSRLAASRQKRRPRREAGGAAGRRGGTNSFCCVSRMKSVRSRDATSSRLRALPDTPLSATSCPAPHLSTHGAMRMPPRRGEEKVLVGQQRGQTPEADLAAGRGIQDISWDVHGSAFRKSKGRPPGLLVSSQPCGLAQDFPRAPPASLRVIVVFERILLPVRLRRPDSESQMSLRTPLASQYQRRNSGSHRSLDDRVEISFRCSRSSPASEDSSNFRSSGNWQAWLAPSASPTELCCCSAFARRVSASPVRDSSSLCVFSSAECFSTSGFLEETVRSEGRGVVAFVQVANSLLLNPSISPVLSAPITISLFFDLAKLASLTHSSSPIILTKASCTSELEPVPTALPKLTAPGVMAESSGGHVTIPERSELL